MFAQGTIQIIYFSSHQNSLSLKNRLRSLPLWVGGIGVQKAFVGFRSFFIRRFFSFSQLQSCFGCDFVIQSSLEMIFASFISNRRCRCALSPMSWLHNCVQRSKLCCHQTKVKMTTLTRSWWYNRERPWFDLTSLDFESNLVWKCSNGQCQSINNDNNHNDYENKS